MITITLIVIVEVNSKIQRNDTTISLKNLFKGLVAAYDCSKPTNVTNYELQDIDRCVEKEINKSIRDARMQILQRTTKYTNQGFTCLLRRSTKVAHCGQSDHFVRDFKSEFTYKQIPISPRQCRKMVEDRQVIIKNNQGIEIPYKLRVNKISRYHYYV